MLGFLILKVSLIPYYMPSSSKYSWYFIIEAKHTIQVNNILDTCCISANPNFRFVNNSDFFKTNMADIYNISNSIAGWRWKESDIVPGGGGGGGGGHLII